MKILCHLLLLSSFVLASSAPKKGKSKEISKASTSSEEIPPIPVDVLISNLKSIKYPCLYSMYGDNKSSASDSMETLKRFRKCKEFYNSVVEEHISKLGLAGEGFTKWMKVVDKFTKVHDPISRLKGNVRNDRELANAFIGTFYDMNQRISEFLKRHAKGESFEADKSLMEQDPNDIEYLLFRSYYFGTGICDHLLRSPLDEILQKVLSIRLNLFSSYRDIFDKEVYPPNDGTPIGRLMFLCVLCMNLGQHESDMRLIYIGNVDVARLTHEGRMKWIEDTIKLFTDSESSSNLFNFDVSEAETSEGSSETTEGMSLLELDKYFEEEERKNEDETESKPNPETSPFNVWHMRRVGSALNFLSIVPQDSTYRDYHSKLNAIGSSILRACLHLFREDIEEAMKILKVDPNYKKALPYMNLITEFITSRKREFVEDSMNLALDVRGRMIRRIETDLFYDKELNKKLDLIEAYKTGRNMCDIFITKRWELLIDSNTYLNGFFELLTEVYRYYKFVPRLRHDSIDLFDLWTVCRQILSLPLTP